MRREQKIRRERFQALVLHAVERVGAGQADGKPDELTLEVVRDVAVLARTQSRSTRKIP